ncbi:MAG: hypothetical protein GF353_10625 [Candidatus Lokiarchaeota archaeon]|nr:hypothetical protein [Candidatus Lokiarchaeota archaeon]
MKKTILMVLVFICIITALIILYCSTTTNKEDNARLASIKSKAYFVQNKKWYSLDVLGFKNVVKGKNLLTIERAFIRDDGENNFWRGCADIGLHIYEYNNGNWKPTKNIRLYGPYYCGIDNDGSKKFEWLDNLGIIYKNFGILKWKNFSGDLIRIKLEEGDHGLTKNDIIFDEIIEVRKLLSGNLVRIDGDLSRKESTLWFKTYKEKINN